MRHEINKELKAMLIFYVVGLLVILMAHLRYGSKASDTPPLSFILLVLFTILGFLWLYIDLLIVRLKYKKIKMTVHAVGLAINVLIILLSIML